nr:radical SAM protein [uncultured Methylophaga sp.]
MANIAKEVTIEKRTSIHTQIPMPTDFQVLQVGITTRCNQICGHCPRETRYEGMSTMSLPQFETYLSQFNSENFNSLIVSDFGEITIVPKILDYLRVARDQGFRGRHFVTNATRKDPKFWQAVAEEQLVSYMIISLEAASDPLYQSIRGHTFGHFRTVLGQISDAFHAVTPKIPFIMNAVCMRENLSDLPAIIKLAVEVGANEMIFVHLNPTNYANMSSDKLCVDEQHLDSCDREEVLNTFREVIAIAKASNIRLTLPEKFPELTGDNNEDKKVPYQKYSREGLRCNSPLNWVQVGLSGEVYPCCQMSQRSSMGNLNVESFESLWNGQKYQRLLDGLMEGGEPLEVCKQCNVFNGKNF